jgi:hypothetical protein
MSTAAAPAPTLPVKVLPIEAAHLDALWRRAEADFEAGALLAVGAAAPWAQGLVGAPRATLLRAGRGLRAREHRGPRLEQQECASVRRDHDSSGSAASRSSASLR